MTCTDLGKCNINGCRYGHNELLHDPNIETRSEKNYHATQTQGERIWFKITPVTLYGPRGAVNTFAFLDDGSSVSMIDEQLAEQLGIDGRRENMTVQWFKGEETTEVCKMVEFGIRGKSPQCQMFQIKNVRAVRELHLPTQSVTKEELMKECPQALKVPISYYQDAKPKLLIGLDNSHLKSIRGFINFAAHQI